MKYTSAFQIIGPIMVGPSSSHTAGAVRIGNIARKLLREEPNEVVFELMGSFAETYQGHGTDLALLSGILGMNTDDDRIVNAENIANQLGVDYQFTKRSGGDYHPNTVKIIIKGLTRSLQLIASSLGGGKVEVQELDGLPVRFCGEKPTFILYHTDQRGFLAQLTELLDAKEYNIVRVNLERRKKSGSVITICEVDQKIDDSIVVELYKAIPSLQDVCVLEVI